MNSRILTGLCLAAVTVAGFIALRMNHPPTPLVAQSKPMPVNAFGVTPAMGTVTIDGVAYPYKIDWPDSSETIHLTNVIYLNVSEPNPPPGISTGLLLNPQLLDVKSMGLIDSHYQPSDASFK